MFNSRAKGLTVYATGNKTHLDWNCSDYIIVNCYVTIVL